VNQFHEPLESGSRFTTSQWGLVALIVAVSAGSVLYKFLFSHDLGHTAATFIGIPALLAILLALAPRPKSATGSILRGIGVALLIIAPLLGEGYLCILMAAPLFLLVGVLIGAFIDHSRRKRGVTLSCMVLVLLPISLEGIVPALTYDRDQTVEVTRTVNAPASAVAAVAAALAESPDVKTVLPRFLRIGFPRPLEAHGTGLALGDSRTIHFAGAEGDPPGDLVLRVSDEHPGYVRFTTVSDTSKLTQWVRWQSSEVIYAPVDATHTTVTWRICFSRQLDPYWYFTPWERFAAGQAAKYLIAANATPTGR